MADEGDSKSLVLITRVGSTPTTGTNAKGPGLKSRGPFCCPAHGNSLRAALLQKQNPEPKFRVFYFKWTVQDSNL